MNEPLSGSCQRCGTDGALDNLFEEITRRVQAGRPVDVEACAREFPDQAEQIRRLLPAIQALADLGLSAIRDAPGGLQAASAEPISGCLGDFRIYREIGRGGMGVVYEAEQISLHRRVALKVLPFAAVLDRRQLQRFQNEALAAASLKHPHIVQVYAVGCERGIHYYAMEYVEGHTLAGIIAQLRQGQITPQEGKPHEPPSVGPRNGGLLSGHVAASPERPGAGEEPAGREAEASDQASTYAETKREPQAILSTASSSHSAEFFRSIANWGIQAAEALEHAHQMGVVHRDVKPSNLMVDGRGHLWVADFGLAMTQTDPGLTMTGDILGTLRYMSPEQAAGGRRVLDCRTDIYSLGVTLYELLALRPPFPGDDHQTLLRQISDENPRPLCQLDKSIPKDVETIVLKAMAKEPQGRYATAQELADDLRRFLADEPVRARRPSLATRAAKWSRRHQPLVWSAVVLLAVSSAISALSTLVVIGERAETIRQRDEVLRREAALRKHLYAADVNWAWRAWNNGGVARARELLARQQPAAGQEDLRSFAWYHLWQLCQSSSRSLEGHSDVVYCMAFSPDGKLLASGGRDRTIVLWDQAASRKLRVLRGHSDDVNSIAFSPDGRLMASADEGFRDPAHPEPKVILWDPADGRLLKTFVGFEYPVAFVRFTPDGKTLVVAEVYWPHGAAKTSLWDLSSGERRSTIEGRRALALSPDGRTLATCAPDWTVRLVDVATQQERGLLRGHTEEILASAFSPDGRTLASGGRGGQVRVWDLSRLEQRAVLEGHLYTIRSLAFSPDGKLLVSVADDGQIRFWEPDRGGLYKVLGGHSDRIWSVALSPDAKTLATASSDKTVKLWDPREVVQPVCVAPHPGPVTAMAFLPDGKTLVTPGPGIDRRVAFWDTETGYRKSVLAVDDFVTNVAVSQVHSLLAVGTTAGKIHLCDLAHGNRPVALLPNDRPLETLALSPDGTLVAYQFSRPDAHGGYAVTRVWDLASGNDILSLKTRAALLAFSPDGKHLTIVVDGKFVQRFDLATRQLHGTRMPRQYDPICLAYTSDAKTLAIGSSDRSIRLFDPQTDQERATLLGHRDAPTALAFAPDGKTLASGDKAGEVLLWDVFTGQELTRLRWPSGSIASLVFSPDGTRLAVGGTRRDGHGEVTIWHASRKDDGNEVAGRE